jgi:hypothetical protein
MPSVCGPIASAENRHSPMSGTRALKSSTIADCASAGESAHGHRRHQQGRSSAS